MAVLDLAPLSIETSSGLSAGVVQGLPQLNQLNEPTSDHAADENARMQCVFTSNAAVSRKQGGHPEANGDAIKDGCRNYGQGYVGGADQDVLAADGCLHNKWGLDSSTYHGANRNALLRVCMQNADAGLFTLVTIPSMWGSQPSQPGYNPDSPNFWTHCCVYVGYLNGVHYLMNPWGGFIMSYNTGDMLERLCYLKVYTLRAAVATPPPPARPTVIDLEKNAQGVITGAHDHDHTTLHVGQGVATLIDKNKQLDHSIVDLGNGLGERYFGARSLTLLANKDSVDSLYTYSTQFGTVAALGFPDLAVLVQGFIGAADHPLPVNRPDYTSELAAVESATTVLHAKLAANKEVAK